jgi:GTP pyrophosphokinase
VPEAPAGAGPEAPSGPLLESEVEDPAETGPGDLLDTADDTVIEVQPSAGLAPEPIMGPVPAPLPDTEPEGHEFREHRGSSAGAQAGRMRARLARIGGRGQSTSPVLEPLFRVVRANHPKADLALLERAYRVAERAHEGQKRYSGEDYITHPLAVTTILAELGMTEPTLVAALLHDTVEDTEYTLARVRADFGDEVASLVDGVTKLDKVKYGDNAQAETIRKMIVAMSRDIRVLVIKLADRLHNMRTLRYTKQASQVKKAKETLEIFAPLAHRLGMNTIKWELEDLAFGTLHPKMYDEIVRLVAERAPSRDSYLRTVIDNVEHELRRGRIKATVTGRPKHYYSIYQKMIVRGRDFSDIYDLIGIRILVEQDRDCYAVLGAIHNRWNPVPGRFKDFVAMPKFNMYQSLHTTVIGPEGKPVEMQIRTYQMHRRAEYGVAAHWKYKEYAGGVQPGDRPDGDRGGELPWMRQLMDWQQDTEDPGEFLESLRFEINSAEVYVFTPAGDVLALPTGSTPVDFAYSIHTEVGHRAIGARVNGRLVPLESTLENGDTVEVFTSKSDGAGPSRDWLTFVKSPRARSKIRHWFTKERREEATDRGKDQIARLIRKEGVALKRVLSHDSLMSVAQELRLADVSALYAAVGEGNLSAQTVVRRVLDLHGGEMGAEEELSEGVQITQPVGRPTGDPGVVVKDVSDVWVKLAKCCTPVPGDAILGFVTRGQGVSVHRTDCVNAGSLRGQPERLVDVEWAPTAQSLFLVNIQVDALDRARLLSDITKVLSDMHVNILSASLTTGRDRVARSRFTFEMADPTHLGHVLRAVRHVEGVFDAQRVTG